MTDGREESNYNVVRTDGVLAEKLAPAKKSHRRRLCRAYTADDCDDDDDEDTK